MPKTTDVLIIGGGITGLSVARELSKYEVDVTVLEKETDVGWGQTKASYAIRHPGARWTPGTLAQQLIAEGNKLMDQLIQELDIEFRKLGELVLAFTQEEIESLKTMKKQAEHIEVKGLQLIGNSELMRMEPNVNSAAVAALYMPSAGVFNPFDLVSGLYENALDNGVDLMTDAKVKGIVSDKNGFIVITDQRHIKAGFIVNAAGLFAENIAQMAGVDAFRIKYKTKGSCLILDTLIGDLVQHIVTGFIDPKDIHRFKLVTPTFNDKILTYTSYPEPAIGIDDRALSKKIFDVTIGSTKALLSDIDFERYIIASYAGLTARNDKGDFIIKASEKYSNFIHAAIPPPGLTCSQAVGKRVVELLKNNGLGLREKMDFNPYRKGIRSLKMSSLDQIGDLVRQDPRYGHVICRCEKVTEGEIIEAIRRGASTLDGVKFRTRACMGRCQANYCGPEITSILARELKQPFKTITKKGSISNYTN